MEKTVSVTWVVGLDSGGVFLDSNFFGESAAECIYDEYNFTDDDNSCRVVLKSGSKTDDIKNKLSCNPEEYFRVIVVIGTNNAKHEPVPHKYEHLINPH